MQKKSGGAVRLPLLSVFAVLLFAVSGCYFAQFTNVEKARELRVGMTRDEVRELMGDPEEHLDAATPDLWFYFVRSRWHDGMVTEDECMPVVFSQDRVVGWGSQFYNRYRLIEMNFYQPDMYRRGDPVDYDAETEHDVETP